MAIKRRDIQTVYSLCTVPNLSAAGGEKVFWGICVPCTGRERECFAIASVHGLDDYNACNSVGYRQKHPTEIINAPNRWVAAKIKHGKFTLPWLQVNRSNGATRVKLFSHLPAFQNILSRNILPGPTHVNSSYCKSYYS